MQTRDSAEIVAIRALEWLAGQEDLLAVFLGATGESQAALPARMADPEFLAAVLDFILMDDAWVLGCAAALGCPPEAVARARHAMPGGAAPEWT